MTFSFILICVIGPSIAMYKRYFEPSSSTLCGKPTKYILKVGSITGHTDILSLTCHYFALQKVKADENNKISSNVAFLCPNWTTVSYAANSPSNEKRMKYSYMQMIPKRRELKMKKWLKQLIWMYRMKKSQKYWYNW